MLPPVVPGFKSLFMQNYFVINLRKVKFPNLNPFSDSSPTISFQLQIPTPLCLSCDSPAAHKIQYLCKLTHWTVWNHLGQWAQKSDWMSCKLDQHELSSLIRRASIGQCAKQLSSLTVWITWLFQFKLGFKRVKGVDVFLIRRGDQTGHVSSFRSNRSDQLMWSEINNAKLEFPNRGWC